MAEGTIFVINVRHPLDLKIIQTGYSTLGLNEHDEKFKTLCNRSLFMPYSNQPMEKHDGEVLDFGLEGLHNVEGLIFLVTPSDTLDAIQKSPAWSRCKVIGTITEPLKGARQIYDAMNPH